MFILQYCQGFAFSVDYSSNLTSNILLLLLAMQASRSCINIHELYTAPFLPPLRLEAQKLSPYLAQSSCREEFRNKICFSFNNVSLNMGVEKLKQVMFSLCHSSLCQVHSSALNATPFIHFHPSDWVPGALTLGSVPKQLRRAGTADQRN